MKKEIQIDASVEKIDEEISKPNEASFDEILKELKEIKKLLLTRQPQANNIIPKQPKKPKKHISLYILPILFLFFAISTYVILSGSFKADAVTKISASFGAGLFIVILASMFNWFFKERTAHISEAGGETDLAELKKCPTCNADILKSPIQYEDNSMKQFLKCSNPLCEFKRQVIFSNY